MGAFQSEEFKLCLEELAKKVGRILILVKETMDRWGHDDDLDGSRSDDDDGSGQQPAPKPLQSRSLLLL